MKPSQRLGLRGRFFLAFGVLCTLTLLASIIGGISYRDISAELNQVVDGNIQTISLMADLKEHGTRLTLLAPTLLAAENDQGRQAIWQSLNVNIQNMSSLLLTISEKTKDRQALSALSNQIGVLRAKLVELDNNVLRKFKLQQQKDRENRRLRWFTSSFLSEIDNLTEDAQQRLDSFYSRGLSDPWILINSSEQQTTAAINKRMQHIYRIKADVSLLINLVDRTQHLPDLNSLIATQTYSQEITLRVREDLSKIKKLPRFQGLRQTVTNIVSLTRGESSMFKIRNRERDNSNTGDQLLRQMRTELASLNTMIGTQILAAQTSAQRSVSSAERTIEQAKFWVLLTVVASLLFSTLIVWLYVGRHMVARITSLDHSMRAIANGNLEQQVQVKGSDEIATMAHSLISFRDQLTTLQEELVQAGKMAAMGQLSAGIAHEINQPLSAISHYAHNGVRLLQSGRLPDAEKNLNQISTLTRRANTIITRLNELARNQPVNLVEVDLHKTVNNVLNLLDGDEIRKATNIRLDFPQPDNLTLADQVQLEQVIMNLVTNALAAVEDQQVKRISIECLHVNEWLEVFISDSGLGISDALREQIFEPFFTTKKRGQNLGLGLAISFNIVKNFGGKLTVANSRDSGATFCIQLPKHRGNK